jgi:site-specific recombinase XerD
VVEMTEEKMTVEVGETFIGAVGAKIGEALAMTFQVVGVKKALAAVSKICKMGNLVQFGDEASECFIQNKQTKKKVMMKKKRGSYVIEVEFVKDEVGADGVWKRTPVGKETITIDSGAEESVCPMGWGESFGMKAVSPGAEMRMVSAAGTEMKHYGSRKVVFAAEGF